MAIGYIAVNREQSSHLIGHSDNLYSVKEGAEIA